MSFFRPLLSSFSSSESVSCSTTKARNEFSYTAIILLSASGRKHIKVFGSCPISIYIDFFQIYSEQRRIQRGTQGCLPPIFCNCLFVCLFVCFLFLFFELIINNVPRTYVYPNTIIYNHLQYYQYNHLLFGRQFQINRTVIIIWLGGDINMVNLHETQRT